MKLEKTVHIIFNTYYDFHTSRLTLGGVQTYLTNLIPVFRNLGFACRLYETGYPEYRECNVADLRIINIPTEGISGTDRKVKAILNAVEKVYNDRTDILLFATDCQIAPNQASRSIVIQHGITWDVPVKQGASVAESHLFIFRKAYSLWKKLKRLSYGKNVVCVDYNFVNWYRASVAHEAVPMTVIPNFTDLAPKFPKSSDKVKIIFARRLETYRGTRLFSKVMGRILAEYENVELVVAGKGPDEAYMREHLESFGERVRFVSYQSGESLQVHSDMHIAVVPTIGSEGTSLSLLEAMSAQCAVVCTNVGGMTNIVLDGYNGLMVSPREDMLYKAIKRLVEDEKLRNQIAQNGYETVASAFSLEKWQARWAEVISGIAAGEVNKQ